MMAGKVAKCIKQYGLGHNKTQQLLRVLVSRAISIIEYMANDDWRFL